MDDCSWIAHLLYSAHYWWVLRCWITCFRLEGEPPFLKMHSYREKSSSWRFLRVENGTSLFQQRHTFLGVYGMNWKWREFQKMDDMIKMYRWSIEMYDGTAMPRCAASNWWMLWLKQSWNVVSSCVNNHLGSLQFLSFCCCEANLVDKKVWVIIRCRLIPPKPSAVLRKWLCGRVSSLRQISNLLHIYISNLLHISASGLIAFLILVMLFTEH